MLKVRLQVLDILCRGLEEVQQVQNCIGPTQFQEGGPAHSPEGRYIVDTVGEVVGVGEWWVGEKLQAQGNLSEFPVAQALCSLFCPCSSALCLEVSVHRKYLQIGGAAVEGMSALSCRLRPQKELRPK